MTALTRPMIALRLNNLLNRPSYRRWRLDIDDRRRARAHEFCGARLSLGHCGEFVVEGLAAHASKLRVMYPTQ